MVLIANQEVKEMILHGEYITIKKVDRNDIDRIYHVYKNCEDFLSLGPVPTASKQMILDDFNISEEEGGIYCGIFLNDIMIGIIDFVLSGYEGNPNHAYLSLLMISANYRKQGIGNDVVKTIEAEIIKNHAIKSIFAGVQVNNMPAIAFWKKMGYRIVSEPQVMPDTTITYKLQKDIDL
jgi:ribosomal protein S18 acetylase RimI-like enzyme